MFDFSADRYLEMAKAEIHREYNDLVLALNRDADIPMMVKSSIDLRIPMMENLNAKVGNGKFTQDGWIDFIERHGIPGPGHPLWGIITLANHTENIGRGYDLVRSAESVRDFQIGILNDAAGKHLSAVRANLEMYSNNFDLYTDYIWDWCGTPPKPEDFPNFGDPDAWPLIVPSQPIYSDFVSLRMVQGLS